MSSPADLIDTLARCHALAVAAMLAVGGRESTPAVAAGGPEATASGAGPPLSARERAALAGYSPAALAKIEAVLMRLPAAAPGNMGVEPPHAPGNIGAKPPHKGSSWTGRRAVLVTP